MYIIKYACVSHKGNIRSMNQDNIVFDGRYLTLQDEIREPIIGEKPLSKQRVFGLFDGMGGEENGEMAAYLAAKGTAERQGQLDRRTLLELCMRINKQICDYTDDEGLDTCGTTAAILLFDENTSLGCNIGDSRVYCCRDGELTQLSKDHSWPVYRNRKAPLLQYLGIPETEMIIQPTFFEQKPKPGDMYLLCSDGLTDMLTGEELLTILVEEKTVGEKAKQLLDNALKAGGRDNISFILISIESKPDRI